MFIEDAHSSAVDRWLRLQRNRSTLSLYDSNLTKYGESVQQVREYGESKMKQVMQEMRNRMEDEILSKFDGDVFTDLADFKAGVNDLDTRSLREALESDRLNRFVEFRESITDLSAKRLVTNYG